MDNGTNMTISDRELIEYLRDRCRRLQDGLEYAQRELRFTRELLSEARTLACGFRNELGRTNPLPWEDK
jgi:hypothetical protein